MTTAVLRRYTPPTCTLEVKAKHSPLSRWTNREVVRDVRFRLSFDDPQAPTAEPVQVMGDRTQLEALTEAVHQAVQTLLHPAADVRSADWHEFAALLGQQDTDATDHPTAGQAIEQRHGNGVSEPVGLAAAATSPTALAIAPRPAPAINGSASDTGIMVQSEGWLSHVLHLGTLATPSSGATLRLSTTQLYDLANALDEYATEAVALPDAAATRATPARWAGIAALFLVALGATGGLARFVMDIAAPTTMQVAQETDGEVATTAEVDSFSLEEEFNNLEPLPTPANPEGTGELPPTVDGVPVPPVPPGGTLQPGTLPPGAPPQAYQAFPPGQGQRSVTQMRPGGNTMMVPANPQAQAPPAAPPAPSVPPSAIAINPDNLSATGDVAISPATGLPSPSAASPETLNEAVAAAPPESAQALPPQPRSQAALPSPINRSGEAPDLPQLAEVRSYFEASWQPPESLNDTLEYRLVVGPAGDLQQIVPMGEVAGLYVDRTAMPLLGEAFVSPLTPYQQATIRLVLAPDGRVQTFLEQLN